MTDKCLIGVRKKEWEELGEDLIQGNSVSASTRLSVGQYNSVSYKTGENLSEEDFNELEEPQVHEDEISVSEDAEQKTFNKFLKNKTLPLKRK